MSKTTKWKNRLAQETQENMVSGDLGNIMSPSPQLPSFFASKMWKQTPPPEPVLVNTDTSTQPVQEPFIEGLSKKQKKAKAAKAAAVKAAAAAAAAAAVTPAAASPESEMTPEEIEEMQKDLADKISQNTDQVTIETVLETPPPPVKKQKTQVEIAIDAFKTYMVSMKKPEKSNSHKNSNFNNVLQFICKCVMFLPNIFDLTMDLLSAWYLERINHMNKRELGNEQEKTYTNHLAKVKKQIKNFFYLLVSLYMVLNWWYSFNYFNRFISTSHLVEVTTIPLVKIVLESNMAFTNIVNYVLFGFKQDEARIPFSKDICALLWKYRSFVFIGFMSILQSVYVTQRAGIEKKFFDAMMRKSNDLSGANIFFTFMSWVRLDLLWSDRMGDRMSIFRSFFITIFVVLLKLLLILAFLPFGIMFLYLFLFFWSFFPLAVFNGIEMFTMIKAMFIDLTHTVDEPFDETPGHRMYRVVLNNIVPFVIFIMFFSILVSNITEVRGLPGTRSAKALFHISIGVFATFMLFFLKFGYNIFREMVPISKTPAPAPAQ